MQSILQKILSKRGVKYEDLDKEELVQFEQWDTILAKEELTLKDLKEFCSSQVGIIESKWKDYNEDNTKKAELIPYHTVYKTLLEAISSPQSSRIQLEKQLLEMIK